jgi:hypothetical protein
MRERELRGKQCRTIDRSGRPTKRRPDEVKVKEKPMPSTNHGTRSFGWPMADENADHHKARS